MTLPLMPKATAIWLVENTALTFRQIADFCGMHELEIKGIADGEVGMGIKGLNPMSTNQLTKEEIEKQKSDYKKKLDKEFEDSKKYISNERDWFTGTWSKFSTEKGSDRRGTTAVDKKIIKKIDKIGGEQFVKLLFKHSLTSVYKKIWQQNIRRN